jgi:hypothetical protein
MITFDVGAFAAVRSMRQRGGRPLALSDLYSRSCTILCVMGQNEHTKLDQINRPLSMKVIDTQKLNWLTSHNMGSIRGEPRLEHRHTDIYVWKTRKTALAAI